MQIARYLSSMGTMAEFEMRKLRHEPAPILVRSIQPALWLVIFGEVFVGLRAVPLKTYNYLQFLTPGILAQSVMFIAIFYGINLIWERDLGLLKLVTQEYRHLAFDIPIIVVATGIVVFLSARLFRRILG